MNEEVKKIINESVDQKELVAVIAQSRLLLQKYEITPTEIQWTVLINHLNEMLKRSRDNEKMTGVDPSLFSEVSQEALEISKEIVDSIGNLPIDEMYVLSIHFEAAKQNEAV